jgi:ech hydrogenase subunit E
VNDKQRDIILRGLDFLEQRTHHYLNIVTTDTILLQRIRGIGVTTHEQAKLLGLVGPTARASDVVRDMRIDAPYAAYTDFPISVVLDNAGDLEARFVVRIKELFESYRVIRQILDHLPSGELQTRMPRRIKEGETISRVEAPRGELFYFIKSNGTATPERIKIRTPTMCNIASVLTLAVGHQLADIPMILVGVDPCFSCNDRVVVMQGDNREGYWSWEQLREYGIEFYRRQL